MSEKTSKRVASVAARLTQLREKELMEAVGDEWLHWCRGTRGAKLSKLLREIREVAASALTQAPDRKR